MNLLSSRSLLLLSFLLPSAAGFSQNKGTPASNVLVLMADNKAYTQLQVSDKGVISMSTVPDTLFLVFTGTDFISYSIQINNGKDAFKLSFDNTDTTGIHLDVRDLHDWHDGKQVALVLNNGALTGIWDRLLPGKPHAIVNDKTTNAPYVQIIAATARKSKPAPTGTYAALTVTEPDTTQQALDLLIPAKDNKFYCSKWTCPTCPKDQDPSKEKDNVHPNEAAIDVPFQYYEHFRKPIDPNQPNAVTAKYVMVYYDKDSSRVEFLKLKRHKGYEYYKVKKSISPLARHEMLVAIYGKADSAYLVDTAQSNNYDNNGADISTVISSLTSAGTALPTPPKTPDSDGDTHKTKNDSNLISPGGARRPQGPSTTDNLLRILRTDSLVDSLAAALYPQLSALVQNGNDTVKAKYRELVRAYIQSNLSLIQANSQIQMLQQRLRVDSLQMKKDRSAVATIKDQVSQLQKQVDSLQKEIATLQKKNAALQEQLTKLPGAQQIKRSLLSLEKDLERFNFDYTSIDGKEKEYKQDLICLILKIKDAFNIGVSKNGADLAGQLINKVHPSIPSIYKTDFKNLIQHIEDEYDTAISRKPRYRWFTIQEQVPNEDGFTVKIRTSKGAGTLVSREFLVSGGLKIDFSTGLFFNGIGNDDFILGKHHFLYRPTRDSVNPVTGAIVTIFTGDVKDTVGNLITHNHNGYGYGAGFLAHIYSRTGHFVNVGLATGLSITNNNNSPINVMLGGSLMFGNGRSRISIVGGLVMGQQKTLSAEAAPFVWNSKTQPDYHLYPNLQQMPQFYTGSNDIPTYNRWVHSYFFGISYNFASLNLGGSGSGAKN